MAIPLSRIGLDANKSKELAILLNDLLANYSIFYQNVRGFHWNVGGENFFELHLKFEELYNDLFLKIDEIAERILTIGHIPSHKFSVYFDNTEIPESSEVFSGKSSVEQILSALGILISKQRNILLLTTEMDDEGTTALMSDYIRAQEKLVWMYSAYLNK